MQRERRATPHHHGGELGVVAALVVLLCAVWATHIGRAVANCLSGSPWQMPSVADSFTSSARVLAGDPAAGLAPPPGNAAGSELLAVSVLGAELIVFVSILVAGRQVWRRWGPGRVLGMATRGDIDRVLGIGRLRRDAAIIRPDLDAEGHAR